MSDLIDLVNLYPNASGGGGTSSHPSLTDLPWTGAGHTGTANQVAGFDTVGLATTYTPAQIIGPITTQQAEIKDPTGWISPDTIDISYDYTTRKVTLTGTLVYYFNGVRYALTSPWVSDAHTATQGGWFLYSTDGSSFAWSANMWSFDQLMVTKVTYGATAVASYALREPHGTMPWQAHRELHTQIGTYRSSGGTLTSGTYAENTESDVATTPGFDQASITDEDIVTSIPARTQGLYTTMYVGASGVSVFDTAASFPFVSSGSYLHVNNISAGTMSAGINNRYYNVYQLLIPAASDANSQLYRMIMVQPQATYTSLTSAQAEDPRNISLGSLGSAATEYVLYARITYVTSSGDSNTGRCRIATGGVGYITGNKFSQTSSGGSVSHSNLAELGWVGSGHTGTANNLAAFDSNGAATMVDTTTVGVPKGKVKSLIMTMGW